MQESVDTSAAAAGSHAVPVDHAIPRGSAAHVLAGPPLDDTMQMTQPELIAGSADAKRQKIVEATMDNLDLTLVIPDGFL